MGSIEISELDGGVLSGLRRLAGVFRSARDRTKPIFRCGRCGSEWQARALFCPYCGMTDHNELVSLVPEKSGSNSVIDACQRCLGYVKTFTTLQGSPPAKVMIDDLASVDLDIAAMQQGYKRPDGAGYALDVIVVGKAMPKPSFFAWSWS